MSQMRSLYSPSPCPPSTSASRHMISSCSTWLKLPFIFLVAGSICINSHTIMSKKIGIVAFLSSMKIKGKMLNVREMFVLPQSKATSLIKHHMTIYCFRKPTFIHVREIFTRFARAYYANITWEPVLTVRVLYQLG